MSFRFLPDDKSAQSAVRRIASEEIAAILAEAEGREQDFDARVHEVRRRCKRLRGLARLVRPQFDGYTHVNAAVRSAMSGLSHTRDAAVVVETLDALTGTGKQSEAMARLREALRARVEEIGEFEEQELMADFAARMRALADEVNGWRLEKQGFAAIEGGLVRIYARMGRAMRSARAEPVDEALHEWRKFVKYHWHHVTLMREAAPDVLGPQRALLDELGETLGNHHNLSVLVATLEDVADENGRADVAALARRRQEKLAKRAFALGRQITAEPPGALARRFAGYWALLHG